MNKSYADEITLMSVGLGKDETLPNAECPSCMGGMTHEKSLSVTRISDGLLYNCYRASCDFQGLVPEKDRSTSVPAGKPHIKLKRGGTKQPKLRRFRGSTINLSAEQHSFFTEKFGFTNQEMVNARIRYCPQSVSYAVPIFDDRGYKVGTIDRSWAGRSPKTINYWNEDAPNLYFPWPPKAQSDRIVLVEDFASAIKVNRHQTAVALLGTNLKDDDAVLLRGLTDKLVIALDPDATNKAIKLSKKYNLLFDGVIVQSLTKDPKDMSPATLESAFNRSYP